jgi:hypothetical protein
MSAKNAWGRSTGYADKLIEQGMEAVRAQQMENWMNQQELRQKKNQHIKMTEQFDQVTYEEDWRSLSKFGVERNQVSTTQSKVTVCEFLDQVVSYSTCLLSLRTLILIKPLDR